METYNYQFIKKTLIKVKKKIINYKEVNNKMQYKILQEGYKKTTQELKENLENIKDKIKVYQRKLSQAIKKRKD